MLTDHKEIKDRGTTLRNQNRSAALGRPAMKSLGGGDFNDSVKSSLLIYLIWLGLDLALPVAWSFGVQLVVFFFSGISVVLFHTLGFFGCHNTFLSSPHL